MLLKAVAVIIGYSLNGLFNAKSASDAFKIVTCYILKAATYHFRVASDSSKAKRTAAKH
jgi:hypothetical protein